MSAAGCKHADDSDQDEHERNRAPPVLPESAKPTIGFTPYPKDAQQHEQRTKNEAEA